MSSAPVREVFRERVPEIMQPLGFPYVESVNLAQPSSDLPESWCSLDFGAASEDRAALGVPSLLRESGTISVQIFTRQQQGDTQAANAAQALRDALVNFYAYAGHLRVLDCAPPSDLDGGDFRGARYALSVDVSYQFDRLVDEVAP